MGSNFMTATHSRSPEQVSALVEAAWDMCVEEQNAPPGWGMAKAWAFNNLRTAVEPFLSRGEHGDVVLPDGHALPTVEHTPGPSTESAMDDLQCVLELVTDRIWPNETIEEAALALCEEAGEVARAVIKRNHQNAGTGDRPTTDWTAELRLELAQVVVVAMKIAQREGFSLFEAVTEERDRLKHRLAAIDEAGT